MFKFLIFVALVLFHSNALVFQKRITSKKIIKCNSKKSNEDNVSKTGRHTYASWHNVKNSAASDDLNSNKMLNDEYDDDMDEQKIKPKESFFGGLLNKLVFYGLDEMMSSRKQDRVKPVFFTKSPFLTVSESIGQKIIDEASQDSSTRAKSQPRTQMKQQPKNEIRLKTKSDFDEALRNLNEELDILNVTIDDLQQSNIENKDQERRLSQLFKKRNSIQEKIDMIQIEYVNMSIRER